MLIACASEWKELPAVETIQLIVSRVSNRLFVDLPLCTSLPGVLTARKELMSSLGRDREWMRLNIDYTTDVAMAVLFLRVTPEPLKPCAFSRSTQLHISDRRAVGL